MATSDEKGTGGLLRVFRPSTSELKLNVVTKSASSQSVGTVSSLSSQSSLCIGSAAGFLWSARDNIVVATMGVFGNHDRLYALGTRAD